MQAETLIQFPLTWQEKLDVLEINESALVEKEDGVRKAINRSFQNSPKVFKIRKSKETGETRVWRLNDRVQSAKELSVDTE